MQQVVNMVCVLVGDSPVGNTVSSRDDGLCHGALASCRSTGAPGLAAAAVISLHRK